MSYIIKTKFLIPALIIVIQFQVGLVVAAQKSSFYNHLSQTNLLKNSLPPARANDTKIDLSNKLGNYRFIVGGHLYGSARLKNSKFPSSSLLGNIENLKKKKAKFFVSLGDNYRTPSRYQMALFRKLVIDRLGLPFYIAPGNHDGANSKQYADEFGTSYFSFEIGSELFIFLNTEFPNGNIIGKQKIFFMRSINSAAKNKNLKNIFIFTHKLIWATSRPRYKNVISNVNAKKQYEDSNFTTEILPKLKVVAKNKNVYWGSGDVGNPPSLGLFYQKDTTDGITYFATGIGDTEQDALLLVEIFDKGKVGFKVIPLANNETMLIQNYNLDFWDAHYAFFLTLKRKVLRVLPHSYFKYGIFAGILVCLILTFLFLIPVIVKSFRRK